MCDSSLSPWRWGKEENSPLCLGQDKNLVIFASFLGPQTSALSPCKLYWTTAPIAYIPVFHLVGNKCLVWEYWSKTSCFHCREAWAMTKIKLFDVCSFCKAVVVGVEKSMQIRVGFMMMLISFVLWLTFILSALHPVILAYYCFCSCTMVVIESLSIAVSHN